MRITVDSEATATLLKQMVDIALKAGGIQNLQGCVAVLNSIVVEPSVEMLKNPTSPTASAISPVDRILRKAPKGGTGQSNLQATSDDPENK